MENGKTGVAVVGYGGMGSWHARELKGIAQAGLCGVYDILPERNEAARRAGINAYDTLEALLADESVRVVTLAIPNDQHRPEALRCMRAGKHVIVEKPAALSTSELSEMIQEARRCGVLLTVHQNRRWDEDFLAAQKIVREKLLGRVFSIESRVHGSRGIPGDWRNCRAQGGGMVYDWGVHLFDQILQMIPGPVEAVFAQLTNVTNEEVDDGFKALLRFKAPDGEEPLCCHIEVGTSNFISLPRWYIQGQNGTAVIEDFEMDGRIVMVSDWEKRDAVPVVTAAGLTKTMAPRTDETIREYPLPRIPSDVKDFYRNVFAVLRGEEEPIVKHAEMMRVLTLMEAVFASARAGQVIKGAI